MTPAPPVVELANLRRVHRAARKRRRRGGGPAESPSPSGRIALDGVSLTVAPGAWVSLLGPNGAGKSTLLRIVATLDAPDAGAVSLFGGRVDGAAAGALRAARRRIGVVFQNPGLDPVLTVRENLACQAALFGLTGAERDERIKAAAAEFGVADRLDDRVGTLSGGLARRVDLTRALLPGPELLLLDEATAGLDPASRAAFLGALERRRAATGGLTIIMSTHLLDEAERAGHVALLDGGRIVAAGSPDELRRSLGANVLRCAAEHADAIERAGLALSRSEGEAVGAGDRQAVLRASVDLISRGAPFRVGPPTLGDVYMARTGKRLGDEGAGE